ncbi:MAG: energy-coupling factor transporter transmembrane protein EcfT [Peptococcaceae bacterium]|jgi:energy-coupling factor transport system permease protein|nr:energy-coupling factor transporter transmembrane protein EcfT [Peptococcaceae bacterium]
MYQEVYVESETRLHRLDPRLKVVALIGISLLISLAGISGLLILSLGVALLGKISRLSYRSLLSIVGAAFLLGLFYLWGMGWESTQGWRLWQGHWSVSGLSAAGMMIWKIFLIFSLTRVFLAVTKPLEMGLSIACLLNPLAKRSRRAADFILLLTLTLRFIPLLAEETGQLWKARAAKGKTPASFAGRCGELLRLVPPVFLISLRRAEELAENLIARGYQPGRYRVVRLNSWQRTDSVALIIWLIWSGVVMGITLW